MLVETLLLCIIYLVLFIYTILYYMFSQINDKQKNINLKIKKAYYLTKEREYRFNFGI